MFLEMFQNMEIQGKQFKGAKEQICPIDFIFKTFIGFRQSLWFLPWFEKP